VVTSQIAGAWLEFVLRKGWPLLTPMAEQGAEVMDQWSGAAVSEQRK
jgi:hypothetical protein